MNNSEGGEDILVARNPTVLVAEDDPNDAVLLEYAFQHAKIECRLVHVQDAQGVMDYLSGRSPFDDRGRYPMPEVLVLDLKLPRVDGFELLQWMSRQPANGIPVVVLSSSELESDRARALELGAAEYYVKPVGPRKLGGLLREFHTKFLRRRFDL